MERCFLCPRDCGVDRDRETGYCLTDNNIRISRIMRHMWEEPPTSGTLGSGTVFFTGCNLRCVYCQNCDISRSSQGTILSQGEFVDEMWKLKDKVHNINLVTAGHQIHRLIPALEELKKDGFPLPIVYNTSSYEKVETLKRLEGLIDIYLPDFKYMDPELSRRYSKAADYPGIAKEAISEMVRQVGEPIYQGDIMMKGVIVRHMVLPGNAEDSMDIIDWLYDRFRNRIVYSIMMQYSPGDRVLLFPEIDRKVGRDEYERILNFTLALGIDNAFIQDVESSSEEFIPDFSRKVMSDDI